MATQLPFDYETEQNSLKRKQAITDALMQRFMTPQAQPFVQNSAGTFYAGGGAVGGLLQGLGLAAAGQGQSNLDDESRALAGKYKEGLTSELNKYEATRMGNPGAMVPSMAPTVGNDPNNPNMVPDPNAAPNPRKAAIEAIVSSYAPLQQIGTSDLNEAAKDRVTVKDLLSHASGSGIESMLTGGVAGFRPKANLKEVGDIVYDPETRQVVHLSGPTPTLSMRDGDLYQTSPSTGGLKKLDNAPKVTINNPQNAGKVKYFDYAAKQVDDLGKQAQASQQLINTLGTLKQLHTAGINSNITSDMATNLANLGQQMGLRVDVNKLGNTETYNSLITDLWQRSVSQYGGNRGVTQAEAEQIKKLTPLASSSPQARDMLFQLQSNVAQRNIRMYQQANKAFAAATAADDPKLFNIPGLLEQTYVPPAGNSPNPGMPGGSPMSLDDYLKSQGGR